ncbi:hypothetical protein [Legionella tunisiensis]|uniref:hypothetical protein n=1 Tax=Legionella tunisiensis TaxID=1034944 RepID=UPI0002D28C7C|nr:hypothetical protein [Legionella tunisiensis]
MSNPIKLQCQKVFITLEKDKITLSPQPTGKQAFSIRHVDDDEIPEIIATDYYHTSELLTVVQKIAATDKNTTINYQLIQEKTVIDNEDDEGDENEIVAVYTQILSFPQVIDKDKIMQLLQLFVDYQLIYDYEKRSLLSDYEKEHPCVKIPQPSAEDLFRQSLDHIKTQTEALKVAGDTAAASVAKTLHFELTQAYDKFKEAKLRMPYIGSRKELEQSYLDFQKSCGSAATKAKTTLDNYWNWKTIFLNLGVAVMTLGVGYLALGLYNCKQGNSLMLFKPYADGAVEKQLHLEELLSNSRKF